MRRSSQAAAVQPPAAPSGPTTNAAKARALIAMLEGRESGPGAPAISPDRLRDWARDLVDTVEKGPASGASRSIETTSSSRVDSAAPPAAEPAQAEPSAHREARRAERAARLFRKAAPKLAPLSTGTPTAVAATAKPRMTEAGARISRARMTLTAPVAHVPARQAAADTEPAGLSTGDVRKLVTSTVDSASLAREHPAVIAMTLAGRPTLEQADALRRLPNGQKRAVHRALRQLEGQTA